MMTSETWGEAKVGSGKRGKAEVWVGESGRKTKKIGEGENVQDSKLPWLEAEDREEGEADDKESEGGQIQAAEEEKAVPATYCWVRVSAFLRMRSSASRVEWPAWRIQGNACLDALQVAQRGSCRNSLGSQWLAWAALETQQCPAFAD